MFDIEQNLYLSRRAGSLLALVKRLGPKKQATEWGNYYTATNYSDEAFWAKKGRTPEQYASGGWGPDGADAMMRRDGREWRLP